MIYKHYAPLELEYDSFDLESDPLELKKRLGSGAGSRACVIEMESSNSAFQTMITNIFLI